MNSPALADLTSLRLGGAPDRYLETKSEAEFIAAVREADAAGQPLLVLGGGSNVVVSDEGFPGVVVRDVRTGMAVTDSGTAVSLQVPAGTPWEDVVDRCVGEGWVGVETLTGIPGSTGGTPVQNVGAYGQEVAGLVTGVRTWDRQEARVRTLRPAELGFGYRISVLKRSLRTPAGTASSFAPTPRNVVLEVTFQLRVGTLSDPVAYPELALRLGVGVGERAPLAEVRSAVLALRSGKGMVLDDADHDTWSAGSFFTNPVLPASGLPEGAPRWAVEGEELLVKTSAAWLIEHAGFPKGYGLPGPVSVSTKHVLALTNRGTGTTTALLALARELRDRVRERFGIELEPEPVLVGVSLDPRH